MKSLRRLLRLNNRLGLRNAPPQARAAVALLQIAVIAILAGVLLYFAVNAVNGLVSTPSDGPGIMRAAREPNSFTYQIQGVRTLTSGEDTLETQSQIDGAVDKQAGKFQARLLHVLPQPTLLAGDGKTTIGRNGDGPLVKVSPTIPADKMLPPQPSDILSANPRQVSDTETIRGQRAWRVDFDLTPAIARKLFLADGLALSNADLDAIARGGYETEWAYALVTRRQPSMVLVYVGFRIDDGPTYRFLVKYSLFDLTEVKEITL